MKEEEIKKMLIELINDSNVVSFKIKNGLIQRDEFGDYRFLESETKTITIQIKDK